jgi:hypothetical protein
VTAKADCAGARIASARTAAWIFFVSGVMCCLLTSYVAKWMPVYAPFK